MCLSYRKPLHKYSWYHRWKVVWYEAFRNHLSSKRLDVLICSDLFTVVLPQVLSVWLHLVCVIRIDNAVWWCTRLRSIHILFLSSLFYHTKTYARIQCTFSSGFDGKKPKRKHRDWLNERIQFASSIRIKTLFMARTHTRVWQNPLAECEPSAEWITNMENMHNKKANAIQKNARHKSQGKMFARNALHWGWQSFVIFNGIKYIISIRRLF